MRSVLLLLMTVALLAACDAEPVSVAVDLTPGEGLVADAPGLADGLPGDLVLSDALGDGAPPAASSRLGELVSGAALSKGGSYTLHSQVGHWSQPVELKGGTRTLRLSAVVLTW